MVRPESVGFVLTMPTDSGGATTLNGEKNDVKNPETIIVSGPRKTLKRH